MNGPHEPIRMKINLMTGSSRLNGNSSLDDPEIDVIQGKEESSSSQSPSTSRPGSNESAHSSMDPSRVDKSDDTGEHEFLKFSLPTTKSRKRKHVKKPLEVKDVTDDETAMLRQKEKERLAEREKRLIDIDQDDHINNVMAVARKNDFELIDLNEQEIELCGPSTSKVAEEEKKVYEVIDVSSGEEEDSWSGQGRRVPPPRQFAFGEYRRRGYVSAAERKQQDDAQAVERKRLKGKNLEIFEKDQILKREGGLLVNPGHNPKEDDIFVAPHLTHTLLPHQLGGVRFMFDNVIVSAEDYKANKEGGGFGCILAHSMGLGKTIQVITMCDIFFRTTKAHKILILCPINVIQNWYNEFSKWFPAFDQRGDILRRFNVFLFGDTIKTFDQRVNLIEEWSDKGGVLLMGYEMFRLLNKNVKGAKPKKPRTKIEFIGGKRVEEEEKKGGRRRRKGEEDEMMTAGGRITKEANELIMAALVDPGPDLIVCDEGHVIKNVTADISITLSAIKTRRRIILTGYPLQNNLMEYYCMVNFVRPDYLGSKKSFASQFEKPIKNGQCVDSTPHDIKIARQRTHVLIDQLKGFVQRRTQHILKQVLPDSREYVILMRKSPIQHILYRSFVSNTMAEMRDGNGSTFNPLKAFAMCSKFWNHPDVLYKCLRELKEMKEEREKKEKEKEMARFTQNAFSNPFQMNGGTNSFMGGGMQNGFSSFSSIHSPMIMNGMNFNGGLNGMMGGGMNGLNSFGGGQLNPFTPFQSQMNQFGGMNVVPSVPSSSKSFSPQKKKKDTLASVLAEEFDLDPGIKYDWAEVAMSKYRPGDVENSPKFKLALNIIDGCTRNGEKIILFSQSLATLTLMEEALERVPLETPNGQRMWNKNVNYLRFDGSTNGAEREKLINRFNGDQSVYLFLISTKAGSLGVNLVSASRCIIFDACWNPCHDAQAVCRIYRYGQQRRTFIYRLVMDNSMEKAIFNRQISKNGLQQRVVDEQHVDANVTQKELESLLEYDESLDVIDRPHNIHRWDIDDDILKGVVSRDHKLLSQEPFLHESLLLEREDGLSEEEKKEALALYQREKSGEDMGIPFGLESGSSYLRNLAKISDQMSAFHEMPELVRPDAPPLRSTPNPMSLASLSKPNWGGGATIGNFMRLNSYQKMPQLTTPMGPPINPAYLNPSTHQTPIAPPSFIPGNAHQLHVGSASHPIQINNLPTSFPIPLNSYAQPRPSNNPIPDVIELD